MKRLFAWSVLVSVMTGCIGQPFANICDTIRPGRMGPNEVPLYGGVWAQQHTIVPLTGPLPGDIGIPPPPGVIPPPAPLPGSPPPTSIQLQAPLPTDIPPPPPFFKK